MGGTKISKHFLATSPALKSCSSITIRLPWRGKKERLLSSRSERASTTSLSILEGQLVWKGSREKELNGHKGRINAMQVSPDGRYIATASEDRTVRISSPYEDINWVIQGSKRGVTNIEFSQDGSRLYLADREGQLRIFRLDDLHTFALSVEPGSKRHEYVISDALWDDGDGLARAILRRHLGFIRTIALTATGNLLARTYDDSTTEWDSAHRMLGTRVKERQDSSLEDMEASSKTKKPAMDDTQTLLAEENERGYREGRRLNQSNQWGDTTDNVNLKLNALPAPKEDKKNSKGRLVPTVLGSSSSMVNPTKFFYGKLFSLISPQPSSILRTAIFIGTIMGRSILRNTCAFRRKENLQHFR